MADTAASIFLHCQFPKPHALKKHGSRAKVVSNSWHPPPNKNSPLIVTYRSLGDVPLCESTGASFDQYLEDKSSVLQDMFQDKQSSKQLTQEEWRIYIPPRKVLFLTVSPVIDIRLRSKSNGANYPLEINLTRWELQGLRSDYMPSQFVINVRGVIYSERGEGGKSKLKNNLEIVMSFLVPPALSFVPENVFRSITESVLKSMVEEMQHKIIGNLLAGYAQFKRD